MYRVLLFSIALCPALFSQVTLDDVANHGVEHGRIYRNDALGLTLRLPAGFVAVPEKEQQAILQAGHAAAYGGDREAAEDEHEMIDNCSRKLYWGSRGPKHTAASPVLVLTAVARKCFPPPPDANANTSVRALAEEITAGLLQPPESGHNKITVQPLAARDFTSGGLEIYEKDVLMHVFDPLGAAHDTYVAVEIAARPEYVVMLMLQAAQQEEFEALKKSAVLSFANSD